MNSTYTSLSLSLLRDAGRRNDSRRLWFATLESKEANKGREKTRRGLLQGRRGRQREQRGTHAGSSEFQRRGKTGEDFGVWQQREKELKTGGWAGELRLKMGQKIRIFGSLEREKQREETQERKHLRH